MKYQEFEKIMSPSRMDRYLIASEGNTRKAMTLYRKNLLLTQELFTVISCFEVALRNSIDSELKNHYGENWLKEGIDEGGIFDNSNCNLTRFTIYEAVKKLNIYSHQKLVSELGFGFWRYLFAQNQFNATGRVLLDIFPSKPKSSKQQQYNNKYIFNQLALLNHLRNRMAHHEPICFKPKKFEKSTIYVRQHYILILQFFDWMEIDAGSLLYGIDHIKLICNEIDFL